ncbi:nonsense-mediated mRNA decay factor SMG8-like [Clavelina lepadiformis]|uniref:nonsense-mediated mRNA decay factor SMG8-like n=1 Tax=Clavelina lepadiformis TaxID=159417 RepID=UPI00404285AB
MEGLWNLPFNDELGSVLASEEVCVVGVFGKSVWGNTSKGIVINKLANTSLFMPHYPSYTIGGQTKDRDCETAKFNPALNGYYDKEKHIVYLHLTNIFDAATLSTACAEMGNRLINHNDAHNFWKSQEVETVFSLVYMFSICHILIVVHPVPTFDISYDKLFHHVGNLRSKMLPYVKDVLKECSVGRDWWVNGRPCPPRLLFVIMRCDLVNTKSSSDGASAEGASSKKRKPPLKRLQHTLEDQVYKILRNSRVLTNNAVNCLFTVPPNQAFIHIMTEQFDKVRREEDPVKSMLRLLQKSCATHRDPTARSRAYRLLTNPPTQWKDSDEEEPNNPLWRFVEQHTDLVFEKKGFKDSVGRNPLPTHFEIPQLKNWLKVANSLFSLFFTQSFQNNDDFVKPVLSADAKLKPAEIRSQLRSQMDPEARFSEARCSKLVSLASAAYQSNLPLHYTSKVHNNQLVQALATYTLHARGPARDKYEQCVREECEAFWNDGRRLCEVRSLTGRHCVHRFHDLPGHLKPQPDANPPRMNHSSRSRSVAASSCGRIQGSRDDPFTLKDANYDFYTRLDGRAPSVPDQDIFKFPIHIQEKSEKMIPVSPELCEMVEQLKITSPEPTVNPEEDTSGYKETQPSVSCPDDAESDQNSTQESETDVNKEDEGEEAERKPTEQEDRQRTTSTNFEFSLDSDSIPEVQSVEYNDDSLLTQTFTEGMIHSLTPEGILPLFSSWSLTRIGPASMYIPNHGLDMPGFIPGTNHLVPWDIQFHTDDPTVTHWPVPGEARKMTIKETKLMQRDSTTRAYVGFEYETPRGQRFICSSPDKAVKVSNSGVVRDSIQPLLDMDMPLYTTSPVSGRSGKMLMGQLMRVLVVTPTEQNVRITIRPKVVPGPPPTPTFHPCQPEITLRSNSLWVLRFPYVYVSESGSHQPPKDQSQLSAWRVLKMLSATTDH